MGKIKIGIVGVGNCASFLIQSIEYYRHAKNCDGILFPEICGYRISDIECVCAFDIDRRKVGKRLGEAIFAEPNNTEKIAKIKSNVIVKKGPVLDGIGEYLKQVVDVDERSPANVSRELRDSGAEIVLNYLPVGAYRASRFYADECLKAGCAFINCIPEFITSDKEYAKRFEKAKLPIIGDDVKGQLGATILSRVLARLFEDRGVVLDRMYQLNFGGNTDFYNLLEESRLTYKRISKTESVQSQLAKKLPDYNIKISPSDYVPWLRSRKVANIRLEGRTFGGQPITIDARLDVEDKSVSAGVVVDAIRAAKIALDRGIGGPLLSASAWTMKSPPVQYPDYVARQLFEDFVAGKRER